MQEPKVSVIMPVYNVEEYLPQCLDSLLAQTMGDFELICVDDGSTDSSPAILEEYARRDSRLRLLRQQNKGGGAARNLGMDNARGEYLIFLDSDDFFSPGLLEKTAERAAATRADVVIFGAKRFDTQKGEVTGKGMYLRTDLLPEQEVFSRREVAQDIFQLTAVAPWVRLYRRSFVESTGLRYQEIANSNDYFFGMCILAVAERIAAVPEALTFYRINNSKSTQGRKEKNTACVFQAIEGVYDELIRRGLYRQVKHSFVFAALSTTEFALRSVNSTQARFSTVEMILDPAYQRMDLLDHPETWYSNPSMANYAAMINAAVNQYHKTRRSGLPQSAQVVMPRRSQGDVLVTVIVPVYNTSFYLEETMASLVGQSLREIEILCIDDGSGDDSLERLLRWAGEDERICVLHQENRGLSVTRNVGLDMAKGRYVYFMDSDDILEQDTLACLTRRAEQEALDVLFFDGTWFFDDEQGEDAGFVPNYQRTGTYDQVCTGVELLTAMRPNGDYYSSACLQINRTDFLRENGIRFIPGIVHEDNPFTFRVSMAARRAGHMNRAFFHRRVRGGSIMTTATSFANAYGYFTAFQDMDRVYQEHRGSMTPFQRDMTMQIVTQMLRSCARCCREMPRGHRGSLYGLEEDSTLMAFLADGWIGKMEETRKLKDLQQKMKRLRKKNKTLEKDCRKQTKALARIKRSRTYRLSRILTWPLRRLRRLIRGRKRK